jgi:hypothetical protein
MCKKSCVVFSDGQNIPAPDVLGDHTDTVYFYTPPPDHDAEEDGEDSVTIVGPSVSGVGVSPPKFLLTKMETFV